MNSRTSIALAGVATALITAASPSVRADTPTLPISGHYIGYAAIAAPSSACPDKAGEHVTLQLQLTTVKDIPNFLTRHVEYDPATGSPVLYKTEFNRKSGAKLSPAGTTKVTDENTGKFVTGTYSAIYTPFDANSFAGTVHVISPTSKGTCTLTRRIVFIRSSDD